MTGISDNGPGILEAALDAICLQNDTIRLLNAAIESLHRRVALLESHGGATRGDDADEVEA